MSLIVKIMCANRGNDAHPRHGHHLYSDVKEVWFNEPSEARGPQAILVFKMATEAEPVDRLVHNLYGNVYVMNEAGRTISSFEVAAGRDLGMPMEALRSWDDLHAEQEAAAPPPPGRRPEVQNGPSAP